MTGEDADDGGYRETARLTYESILEMRRLAFGAQVEYGRWLISSIFLMHGSAIAGLAFKAAATGAPPYLLAISWFVAGLVFALASGFAAWWNFSLAAEQYNNWAQPMMMFDRAHWPMAARHGAWITATKWLAVFFGYSRSLF